MKTDESLMLEFQKGERAAFEALFGRYRDRVFGFFRRRLAQAARAEELTQETFLAVLRGTEKWEPRALFRTWLFAIAMKQLFAERRKRASHPEGAASEGQSEEFPAGWEPSREGAAHTAGPEQGLWVRQALGRLEESEREILMLREYEQLSYDEIAALLGIPVNTVRSRLYRARMALRDALLGQPSRVTGQTQGASADAARWLARPAVKLEGGS